jgi:hypothetical protein
MLAAVVSRLQTAGGKSGGGSYQEAATGKRIGLHLLVSPCLLREYDHGFPR